EPSETSRIRGINLAAPFRAAGRAEEDQVLEAEERFGFAVAFLLFPKRTQGEAAMMPDDRRGTEGNGVTRLLDSPAKIDVVAGLMIFGIEPADVFKGPAIPRHVTTRNVFRDRVREQDVARPAGRGSDAGLHPVSGRRRNVRSADPGVIAAQKRAH